MTEICVEFERADGEESLIALDDPGSDHAPLWDDVRCAFQFVPDDAIITGVLIDDERVTLP